MQTIDERPKIKRVIKFSRAQEEKRQLICSAIRQLRPIEFLYLGGYRTVEPFALGVVLTDHQDNESLLCFQTAGFSDLLETVGWKLYRVSNMQELEVLPRNFSPDRPGYERRGAAGSRADGVRVQPGAALFGAGVEAFVYRQRRKRGVGGPQRLDDVHL